MITPEDLQIARLVAGERYGPDVVIERGPASNNALVRLRLPDSGAVKILKLAPTIDSAPVRKEVMLIELLRERNIPVPVVEHVETDAAHAGRPFFIMQSAGEETLLDRAGRSDETSARLFTEMGEVFARVHGLRFTEAGDIRPEGIVPRDATEFLDGLYRFSDRLVDEMLMDDAEAALFRELKVPETQGTSLCHSDFHTVQCVVNGNRIAAIVDWEAAWSGNSAIDVALTHAYLDYTCPAELRRCFFAGYTSVRGLPPDYDSAYIPVRMAQVLGVLRAWCEQGPEVWEHLRKAGRVRRMLELYRTYARGALI